MKVRVVRKEDQSVADWAGGTTTQLAIWPEDADYASRKFEWRLSSAQVKLDESEFTPLPCFHRILMTLSGKIHLTHTMPLGEVRELELLPFIPTEFEGAWRTQSTGKCWDFNLMTRVRSGWSGIVNAVVPGSGSGMRSERLTGVFEAFYCLCHNVAIQVVEPSGQVQEFTLHTRDFMLIEPELNDPQDPSKASVLTMIGPCEALGVRVRLMKSGK